MLAYFQSLTGSTYLLALMSPSLAARAIADFQSLTGSTYLLAHATMNGYKFVATTFSP